MGRTILFDDQASYGRVLQTIKEGETLPLNEDVKTVLEDLALQAHNGTKDPEKISATINTIIKAVASNQRYEAAMIVASHIHSANSVKGRMLELAFTFIGALPRDEQVAALDNLWSYTEEDSELEEQINTALNELEIYSDRPLPEPTTSADFIEELSPAA